MRRAGRIAGDQPDDRHLGLRCRPPQLGEIGIGQHGHVSARISSCSSWVSACTGKARNAWAAASRSGSGSSGRLCNNRCTSRPRLKRSRPSTASGDRVAGSGPLGRDGASGFGGLGSDGGGAETQAGSVPGDAHPGDPLVAARRRGLPAAEPQRLARPAVPLADQRAGVERDGIGQPGPAGLAQRMPARRLARRPLVLPAANIEAVLRPGQRDVEQAAVFLQAGGGAAPRAAAQ